VFFVQERIGLDEQPFKVYKLRTMRATGDRRSVTLMDDPRVFFMGRLARKLKIDELPQLLNVLNGTMSLVGPRPTVQEDYERMNRRQRSRCRVLPGLTGLAQVRGNTSLTWPQRIEYDLFYVENQSLWLDLKILARTALLVLTFRAETHPQGISEWDQA
jgi:lipopolysaccharide/colanic/teichoic acid biosynthesis glycosyltransferase